MDYKLASFELLACQLILLSPEALGYQCFYRVVESRGQDCEEDEAESRAQTNSRISSGDPPACPMKIAFET